VVILINYIGGKLILLYSEVLITIFKRYRGKLDKIELSIKDCLEKKVEIPLSLLKAIILIEDRRYYHHLGIDVYAIFRTLKNNIYKTRKQGASTITQQLVRIILNEREIRITRKIQEILLSVAINSRFSKEQIIFCYCQLYHFDKCVGLTNLCLNENYDITNLNFFESCQIAARFKYPILRHKNYSHYLKRVRIVEISCESLNR
jgi:hypothetical protein